MLRSLDRAVETAALLKLRPEHRATHRAATLISASARGGWAWAGVTLVAEVAGGTVARAGRHGALAWCAAEVAINPIKRVADRSRPIVPHPSGPEIHTPSMPSSHVTCAFAYATAAALESPGLGAVALPLAAAIGWARMADGRHFPTDVLAGAAIGAALGVATSKVLARRAAGASEGASDA